MTEGCSGRAPRAARSVQIALIALCSLAAVARAEITPEARAALDRYVAASGGRASLDAIHTTHMKLTITAFGLTGRTDSWLESPDHRGSEVALGPFKLLDGYDGTTGWRTDPSGKLIVLDGKDLEEASGSAWFENDRWLAPDQGGGKVTLAGVERDSNGTYTVIEATPPTGRTRRVYLDQKTWLIARTTSKNDQMTVTTVSSDWREVAGRKIPFRTLQRVAGMSANDVTLTVDSVWVNEPIPASRFAPPGQQASAATYLKTPGVAHVPFEYSARHVWIKASVNGGPLADFLYDTGASISVLDSAYAARIGLVSQGRIQGQGAGATGSGAFSGVNTLRVQSADGDGIELKDLKVAVLNLNSVLAPFFWREAAGVVGFDFIGRFVNEIDYDRRVLTFYDPAAFKYEGKGTSIPMTLAGHAPAVKFTIDGTYSGDFRLDVGSGSTVDLHGPFVKRYRIDSLLTPTLEVMGGGFGGTFTSRLGRMKSMAIGPYSWKGPLVALSGAESGALASEDYAGNVGNQILERFKLTLDYEKRLCYLEPGARIAKPDVFSRSGLQLSKIDGAVRAARVMPGSAGEKAGVRDGDVIVSIAGKPAGAYTVDEADALLDQGAAGSRVKLELKRDGKKKKATVKLADVL
jgi:hypothetical protein